MCTYALCVYLFLAVYKYDEILPYGTKKKKKVYEVYQVSFFGRGLVCAGFQGETRKSRAYYGWGGVHPNFGFDETMVRFSG